MEARNLGSIVLAAIVALACGHVPEDMCLAAIAIGRAAGDGCQASLLATRAQTIQLVEAPTSRPRQAWGSSMSVWQHPPLSMTEVLQSWLLHRAPKWMSALERSVSPRAAGASRTGQSLTVPVLATAVVVAILVALFIWRCQSTERKTFEQSTRVPTVGPSERHEVWIPPKAVKAPRRLRDVPSGEQPSWPKPRKETAQSAATGAASSLDATFAGAGASASLSAPILSSWSQQSQHLEPAGSGSLTASRGAPSKENQKAAPAVGAASAPSTAAAPAADSQSQSRKAKKKSADEDMTLAGGIADRVWSMGKSVFKKSGAKDVYKAARTQAVEIKDKIEDYRDEALSEYQWAAYKSSAGH